MTRFSALLPEFDQEMANTRKLLELLPDDKLEWQAHPKLNSLGWVAHHLSDIPGWAVSIVTADEFDASQEAPPNPRSSRQENLDIFDANVANARPALSRAPDEDFDKPWRLLYQGEVLFELPKGAVIRTWVLNHIIHHRAHLCVYYRLNEISYPGMYGPTADETLA